MAILTSSQQTFVDITDQRKLSAYITSNLPKSQIEDPNVLPHTYAPDWASTPLTLTPVVFLDQTNLALDASGLTISWKRKEGNGAEAALTSGESVSKGVLTVNANKLSAATSGMLTYLCYISYYDSETKNTVNISADITYTLIRNAQNANGAAGSYGSTIKSYSITGGGYSGSASTLTTGFLNNSGTITFKATVTDSRGRVSAEASVSITVTAYSPPYFNSSLSQRCLSNGTLDDDGTYIHALVSFGYSTCGGKNTLKTSVQYKQVSAEQWADAGATFASNTAFTYGKGQISTETSYSVFDESGKSTP